MLQKKFVQRPAMLWKMEYVTIVTEVKVRKFSEKVTFEMRIINEWEFSIQKERERILIQGEGGAVIRFGL